MPAAAMTVEKLVAEARRNRTEYGPPAMTAEHLQRVLTMALNLVLDSSHYEADLKSAPAVVARVIAALIANVEDAGYVRT